MKATASLTALATAGLFLLPFAAAAEDSFELTDAPPKAADTPVYRNEVTAGSMWQSNTSAYFGRYTGLEDKGWYAIGDLKLHAGDAWDSGETGYADLVGTNLGLDSRTINGKFGQQGTWGITFGYDQIPYWQSNSFHSVFGDGNGGLVNGVRPGSVDNVATGPNSLNGRLATYNVGLERQIYTAGGKYQIDDWTVAVTVRHEHKDGLKENSHPWVTNPGMSINPATGQPNQNITTAAIAYFAEPVDYDSDRYDVSATYNGQRVQAVLTYVFMNYTDNIATWDGTNPFLFSAATTGGVSYSPLTGYRYSNPNQAASDIASVSAATSSRYSLPPSNSAHQIKAQVGYNLTPTTRINANLQYGLMYQNEGYPEISGNPNVLKLMQGVNNPSSLDGAYQTAFANIAITSRPLTGLDLRAAYTLDDREALTAHNRYSFYLNDGVNPTNIGRASATNLRLSNTVNKIALEANYRILPETKLLLGYNFASSHRTDTLSGDVTESAMTAKVRSHLLEDLFGTVSYQHSDRWAGNYNRNNTFSVLNIYYTPTAANNLIAYPNPLVPTGTSTQQAFLPYYGLYDYFLSSRVRDEFKATADWSPLEEMNLSIVAKMNYDYYPQSAQGLGLKSNNNFVIGPDLTYQFSPTVGLHAFYEYQKIFFNQNNLVNNAICNANGQSLTPPRGSGCLQNGVWNMRTNDVSQTAGVTLTWQALDDLKVSADYNFVYGNTNYAFADGGLFFVTTGAPNANLMIAPLPNVQAMMNTFTLRGEYKIRENISLLAGYTFEKLSYKDYATTVGSTQISNALMPGDTWPNNAVQIVGAAISVRW